MPRKKIGALVIGQSPRPDLVAPLMKLLPGCDILQAGALDSLTSEDLPDITGAIYPLVTRMNDGILVMVEESFIAPKLQKAIDRLEAKGVEASILLCAGTFATLNSNRPLFKPFNIGAAILESLQISSIGLIAPVEEQEVPIRKRWESIGLKATVWTSKLGNQDQAFHQQIINNIQENDLECVVLDYVGHPKEQVEKLQNSIDLPVIDLGYLTMITFANTL